MRWATAALLAAAALAVALAAERFGGPGMPQALGDLVAGLALMIGGAAMWRRAAGSRSARLMTLTGVSWFAGDAWGALLYVHRGPLVHLVLTYPRGRTRSPVVLLVIAAAYVDGFVPAVARSPWATLALAASVVAMAVWRRLSVGVELRARTAAAVGAVAVGGTLGLAAIGRLSGLHLDGAAPWLFDLAVAATAVILTAETLTSRTSGAVTGLVVDLGDGHDPHALRSALARAFGDPSLEIAYRTGDLNGWVDEAGRPARPPEDDGVGRVVTYVHENGAPIAAMTHDPATLDDRELVASASTAAHLALVNVRMQAEIAARLREVAGSRGRLVEAGDDERRRLDDELRLGAESRLAHAADGLDALCSTSDQSVAERVGELARELAAARADLRRFAQGIHPRTLTERGLGAALTELAAQSAAPVTLVLPDRRFPPAHEAAAFFVCSEALTNVVKHAPGTTAEIAVSATAGGLHVRVADHGMGGADLSRGSGLRGLTDRVEALGGTVQIRSPAGAGTCLDAELPIAVAGDR
jgi:signal transduction histidine kinase